MPDFRGNIGNLMQHWTFLKALDALSAHSSNLQLVDAFAMAPQAEGPTKPDRHFLEVRNARRKDISTYVGLWAKLVNGRLDRYPSTAAFAVAAWPETKKLSLELCELDAATVQCIEQWLQTLPLGRVGGTVQVGDWRDHFRKGLHQKGDFCFVSFDPNMFHWRGQSGKSNVMCPGDLLLFFEAIKSFTCPVLVQISTYSANGPNKMPDVSRTWAKLFSEASFQGAGLVKANGHNMSGLFGNRLPEGLACVLSEAVCTDSFNAWLNLARIQPG